MKLDKPENENYAAVVVELLPLHELTNCDNLVGASIFGFQALVSKDHYTGQRGIVFTAETELSDEFCFENNLYRHGDKNKFANETGYLEDNRRIRAIRLRGHRSDCLFLPLECLSYTGSDISQLKVGDAFDTLNGHGICKKYVIHRRQPNGHQQSKQIKQFVRVNPLLFPEHLDTENYFRNYHLIPDNAHIYVTQKVHGTSWRGSRSLVLRKLSWKDKLARRLGINIQTEEWDTVAGSRKVIKDPNNPDQLHFYSSDIWTDYLKRIEDLIPEGFIIYGELVGWTPDGAPIQTGYTYGMPEGTHNLYVYRISTVNSRGYMVDLSWPQVKQFCEQNGLDHVVDLWEGAHKDFIPGDWLDKKFQPDYPKALPVAGKLVDEGVCVRWDQMRPIILKAKSPLFLTHETKLLDQGESNMEDEIEEVR